MSKKKSTICILLLAIISIAFLPCLIFQKEKQEFAELNEILAIFIGEEKSKTFPARDSGYIFDHIECTNDEEAKWDDATWELTVSKIKKSTKCNIYFSLGFTEKEFAYTGAVEEITIPISGNYKLEVWGAKGGNGSTNGTMTDNTTDGGKGGYSTGTVYLEKNTTIFVQVGGEGNTSASTSEIAGGYNGGGTVVADSHQINLRGSGGGATDIRIGENTLYHRVIVAGGGGGTGGIRGSGEGEGIAGGYGGGIEGSRGLNAFTERTGGNPGTQIAGGTGGTFNSSKGEDGSFGIGGNTIAYATNSWSAAAGGGGWYGGGAGGPGGNGGGGGSGWIYTEASFNTWNAGNPTDAANWKLDTKYYLTDAETIAGNESMPTHDGTGTMIGNSENGYAKITLVR